MADPQVANEIKAIEESLAAAKPVRKCVLNIYYGSAEDYKTDGVLILKCFKPGTAYGVPSYVYRGVSYGTQLIPQEFAHSQEYKQYRRSPEYKQGIDRLIKSIQFAINVQGPIQALLDNTDVESIGIEHGEIAGRFLITQLEEALGSRVRIVTMGFPRTWTWENTQRRPDTNRKPGKPIERLDDAVENLNRHFGKPSNGAKNKRKQEVAPSEVAALEALVQEADAEEVAGKQVVPEQVQAEEQVPEQVVPEQVQAEEQVPEQVAPVDPDPIPAPKKKVAPRKKKVSSPDAEAQS